jgi:hypothetical protein
VRDVVDELHRDDVAQPVKEWTVEEPICNFVNGGSP